jgi:hypothetical protein
MTFGTERRVAIGGIAFLRHGGCPKAVDVVLGDRVVFEDHVAAAIVAALSGS